MRRAARSGEPSVESERYVEEDRREYNAVDPERCHWKIRSQKGIMVPSDRVKKRDQQGHNQPCLNRTSYLSRLKPYAIIALSSVIFWLLGCQEKAPPKAPFQLDPSSFQGDRAFEEVKAFISHTPRVAGTKGAQQAAHYLKKRLESFGVLTELDRFNEESSQGIMTFQNVVATIPGSDEGWILIGSHYDTKSGIAPDFEGANDSGSSTGVLLELAQIITETRKRNPGGPSFELVFFDAEERLDKGPPPDGLRGSRHHADRLVKNGRVESVIAVIILDMIGDRDLSISVPPNSTPFLTSLLFESANEEGVRSRFSLYPHRIEDDHVPFLQQGIPAIDIIDFYFGSAPYQNDYWHTTEDRIDKISPESLTTVARVTLRLINRLVIKEQTTFP